MKFNRFIVCGDSFSEGMTDEIVNGKFRGWADRVADGLAVGNPAFEYANLAIRGKLLPQVIEDQLPVAISFVTGRETLVSFHAGANDALRVGYDAELAIARYKEAVRQLAASGATVLLFTVLEDTGGKGKRAELWKSRFEKFNEAVRDIGAEVGAVVSDANGLEFFKDARFLAFDRLHLNADGHYRVGHAVLESLGYPFNPDWTKPLPPAKKRPALFRALVTFAWFVVFALPWIWRRLRGKSSGDNRVAKYPALTKWPTD